MKKLTIFAILCALLLGSCTNNELDNITPETNREINLPDLTAAFADKETTKTYVENGKYLRWHEADLITAFFGNTLNRQYKFKGKTGDNSGTFALVPSGELGTGNKLGAIYAVYPYEESATITDDGVIQLTLPATQAYAENSFGKGANTMIAVTESVDDTFLPFKNACGYLQLKLYGDTTLASIEVKGNNEEKIAGAATATIEFGGEPSLVMGADATSTVTVDCGEGITLGTTAETATVFWFALPETTFEGGITITATDTEGKVFEKSTTKTVTITRNDIQPMAALEVDPIYDITQIANKGFVCFRTDDNTPSQVATMRKLVNIVDSFGFRYSMSVNVATSWVTDEDIQYFQELQQRGYELCDHTPNNTTRYVDILSSWKSFFEPYIGTGITEIRQHPNIEDRLQLGLKFYSNIDYMSVQYGEEMSYTTKSGTNIIKGDFTIASSNPEQAGVANMTMNGNNFGGDLLYVYIPKDNGAVKQGWNLVKTKSASAIGLADIFGNEVQFSSDETITMYIMNQRVHDNISNIELADEAVYCLLLAGQLWWQHLGLEKPKTWVQVGGDHPHASSRGLQKAITSLRMGHAECISRNKLLTYNCMTGEEFPKACTWWDGGVLHFDSKNESILESTKLKIATKYALNHIATMASHHIFPNFSGTTDEEKEQNYLIFMYEVFKFLKDNNIPVLTLGQRTELLLNSTLESIGNAIPPLSVDLTNRGVPDGFTTDGVISTIVSEGGMVESDGYAIAVPDIEGYGSNNRLFFIRDLGGLSKGKNKFGFYVKGKCSLYGFISPYGGGGNLAEFGATTNSEGWEKIEVELDIPQTTNFISIAVQLNGVADNCLISNIYLQHINSE